MSAVSNLNGTGPADAAHRTDAPVWAFHLALAYAAWVLAAVAWHVNVWEERVITRHPIAAMLIGIAGVVTVAAAIVALVVNA